MNVTVLRDLRMVSTVDHLYWLEIRQRTSIGICRYYTAFVVKWYFQISSHLNETSVEYDAT